MWSDNETQVDLLDFSHLVAAVESVIQDRRLLPATVGVFGQWGSGKSSLMRMIRARVEEDKGEKVLCISFNGWLFEGYEDAKTALMSTILKEIADSRSLGKKASDQLAKLVKRVNWMRLAAVTATTAGWYALAYAAAGETGLGAAVVSDASKLARMLASRFEGVSEEEAEKFIEDLPKEDQDTLLSMREFHEDFADLLKGAGVETLVVFIDDLDRCTPDTVIGTLEAIRLFLFAPQSVFVIGADESLVRHAVRQRFPGFQGAGEVGRDYLEKLVQFPVRIPPLGRAELETYINLLFAERVGLDESQLKQLREAAVARAPDRLYDVAFSLDAVEEVLGEVSPELRESIALAGYLAPVLATGLSGNPRQTKRFLNTLMMRRGMAESREEHLELRILAKLMLLEYFKPEAFEVLARLQAEQMGRPRELAVLEQYANTSDQDTDGVSPVEPGTRGGEADPEQVEGSKGASKIGKGEPARGDAPDAEGDNGAEDVLGKSLRAWLSDTWITQWLASEPWLSTCDLRPYFFFSRERLGVFGGAVRRLSPKAQDVLARITSQSDIHRREATRRAGALSEAEAASVFSTLVEQAKQQEDLSDDRSVLYSLFELVETRPELNGQLVMVLEHLAESSLSVAHPGRLVEVTQGTEAEEATLHLLERWSKSTTSTALATAARFQVERLTRARGTGRTPRKA